MMTPAASRPLRVLAISGSLRRESYNRMLLREVARRAPEQLTIGIYDQLADIPSFNEDLETPGPPVITQLRERVAASDGLLFSTPEYNQSLPGVLKNVIDWLSRPDPGYLVGKPVALMGVTAGRWGTRLAQAALRQTLAATEAVVMPSPTMYLRDGARLFQPDGAVADPQLCVQLDRLLQSFAQWVAVMSARPA
jgi:chromate reductase